jgi:ABC-type transport system involved in multi-copper enzyme maturation permease subunit
LLTTLLRPGKIIFAKLMAALRVSTVLTFLLTEQLLLAYLLIPELRDRFLTLVEFLAIIAATCLITSTVGLLCSSLTRRTSRAMVFTYLTLLLLFVGPVGLGFYLEGFARGVSAQQLSALTITSPFSAAFSVSLPIKASIADAQTAGADASSASILVPRIGLPVWGVFLLLTFPLCAVLYVVTYFAFRWRWWKASNTI